MGLKLIMRDDRGYELRRVYLPTYQNVRGPFFENCFDLEPFEVTHYEAWFVDDDGDLTQYYDEIPIQSARAMKWAGVDRGGTA